MTKTIKLLTIAAITALFSTTASAQTNNAVIVEGKLTSFTVSGKWDNRESQIHHCLIRDNSPVMDKIACVSNLSSVLTSYKASK